jgi:heptose I phosphotransferase
MLNFYSNIKSFQDVSFEELFNIQGNIVRSSKNRETVAFLFKNKKYFIKRFSKGSLLQNFLNELGIVNDVSNAENEYSAYKILQDIGVETPKLVCYGNEKKIWNNRSFVISEEITNFEQLDFFFNKKKYHKVKKKFEDQVYKEIVEIVSKLHKNGIIHHDLYLCHFLLDLNSLDDKKNNPKIYLIDFHRLQKKNSIGTSRLIKELGDLLFSIKYFGDEEKYQKMLKANYFNRNFLETYDNNIQKRANTMLTKYKTKYG